MTAIAARIYPDRVEMSADSAVTITEEAGASHGLVLTADKVIKVKDYLVGGAGDDSHILTFFGWIEKKGFPKVSDLFAANEWVKKVNAARADYSDTELDAHFLLYANGLLWTIEGFSVSRYNDYAAIGSGRTACLVAMDFGASPHQAVEAACRRNVYCRPPVKDYTIPFRAKKAATKKPRKRNNA